MNLSYYLAQACNNAFVLVDLLHEKSPSTAQLKKIHACLMHEDRDDAIILVNGTVIEETGLQFEMVTLGADYQLGAFCGNGSRACAAYLYRHYANYQRFYIQTEKFTHALSQDTESHYTTQLSAINFLPDPEKKLVNPAKLMPKNAYHIFSFEDKVFYYADAIEPHLLLNENLSNDALTRLADHINQDTDIFPLGINVTAYHAENDNTLHAKTYERGIRRITASCGTGAACVSAFYLKGAPGEVTVVNPGGVLQIINHPTFVELKGPAEITMSKTYPVDLAG